MRWITRHRPQSEICLAVALLGAIWLVLSATGGLAAGDGRSDLWDNLIVGTIFVVLAVAGTMLLARSRRPGLEGLGGYRAQSIFHTLSLVVAPPIAAGTLALAHNGRPGDALVVTASMLASTLILTRTRYPLHLSRFARLFFGLIVPLVGIAVAFALAAALSATIDPSPWVVPLLGAWLVTFIGEWLQESFNAARPIQMAVIGRPELASALALEVAIAARSEQTVVGWVLDEEAGGDDLLPELDDAHGREVPLLGRSDDIRRIVLEGHIDALVMTPSGQGTDAFQRTVEDCVDLPVRLIQAAKLYEDMHGRVPIGSIGSAWFAYLMHPNFAPQTEWSKRLLDVLVSGLLLLVLAPTMLVVAILVRLDGGPALFRQRRVGAGGVEFDVLKFRSMQVNAEEAGIPQWAQEQDPRVTAVGRVLRASHLDEMPQLINILRGDMSLVGPRPERPEFVARLETSVPYYSRRVLVKPGLTGWAQVRSGYAGSDVGTAMKLCHDLYYIKHRSFLFDLLTLVETVRTLFADVQYGEYAFSEAFIVSRDDGDAMAAPMSATALSAATDAAARSTSDANAATA